MTTPFYRLCTAFYIKVCLIENEWLVYHTGTGHTHRLNDIVGAIFSCLWYSREPVDIESVKLSVPDLLDSDEITKTLESLLALHLIENVA